MANFFKRGKKIIISVEKAELQQSGERLLTVLGEALPLDSGNEILLNIGACEEISIESVAVLTAFARETRRAGCLLKVTASSAVRDQFATVGLDRHFQILSAAS